jgi:plastocyanin
MKAKTILAVPLLLAVSLCARSEAPAAPTGEATISIREFMFAPTSITVAPGTTVRWKNLDGEPHTVRSVETGFRSDPLDQNDSFTYKFDKPGTYRYVCSIHPQMIGTIVVKAGS